MNCNYAGLRVHTRKALHLFIMKHHDKSNLFLCRNLPKLLIILKFNANISLCKLKINRDLWSLFSFISFEKNNNKFMQNTVN